MQHFVESLTAKLTASELADRSDGFNELEAYLIVITKAGGVGFGKRSSPKQKLNKTSIRVDLEVQKGRICESVGDD